MLVNSYKIFHLFFFFFFFYLADVFEDMRKKRKVPAAVTATFLPFTSLRVKPAYRTTVLCLL